MRPFDRPASLARASRGSGRRRRPSSPSGGRARARPRRCRWRRRARGRPGRRRRARRGSAASADPGRTRAARRSGRTSGRAARRAARLGRPVHGASLGVASRGADAEELERRGGRGVGARRRCAAVLAAEPASGRRALPRGARRGRRPRVARPRRDLRSRSPTRERVREVASIVVLCELAGELAGGGRPRGAPGAARASCG